MNEADMHSGGGYKSSEHDACSTDDAGSGPQRWRTNSERSTRKNSSGVKDTNDIEMFVHRLQDIAPNGRSTSRTIECDDGSIMFYEQKPVRDNTHFLKTTRRTLLNACQVEENNNFAPMKGFEHPSSRLGSQKIHWKDKSDAFTTISSNNGYRYCTSSTNHNHASDKTARDITASRYCAAKLHCDVNVLQEVIHCGRVRVDILTSMTSQTMTSQTNLNQSVSDDETQQNDAASLHHNDQLTTSASAMAAESHDENDEHAGERGFHAVSRLSHSCPELQHLLHARDESLSAVTVCDDVAAHSSQPDLHSIDHNWHSSDIKAHELSTACGNPSNYDITIEHCNYSGASHCAIYDSKEHQSHQLDICTCDADHLMSCCLCDTLTTVKDDDDLSAVETDSNNSSCLSDGDVIYYGIQAPCEAWQPVSATMHEQRQPVVALDVVNKTDPSNESADCDTESFQTACSVKLHHTTPQSEPRRVPQQDPQHNKDDDDCENGSVRDCILCGGEPAEQSDATSRECGHVICTECHQDYILTDSHATDSGQNCFLCVH